MNTATVTLTLDAELAKQYEDATPEQQRKAQLMFELLLRRMTSPSRRTLSEVMDEISDKAEASGLTEDMLDDILNDE
jgi:hypothetical protein